MQGVDNLVQGRDGAGAHPVSVVLYARSRIAIRPVATPVLASFREYPFSEFPDPLVLQALRRASLAKLP